MNKKIILVLFVIFSSFLGQNISVRTALWGIDDNAGTTGFSFLKLNYSARTMGMANAFTALSNDADAVFFNPAGLAQNFDSQVKTTYINYVEGMQGGSLVYATRLNPAWKIAPFAKFLVSDDIQRTIEKPGGSYETLGNFNTFSMVAGSGFATTINEHFDIGFNIKYFYEKLDDYSASAIGGDISVLHQTTNDNLKLGVSLKNAGMQLTYYTEEKYEENLPIMLIVGASYKLAEKGYANFDLVRPFDNDFSGRLGLEYYYNPYFTIRAGFDTRTEDYKTGEELNILSGFSLGFGFNWNKNIIDMSISSMGSLGSVKQISLSYLF